jgi:hypothetical protein
VQRSQRLAAHDLRLGAAGGLARALEVARRDRVDRGIEGLDARDARVHQLHRRDLAAADQPAQLDCGQFGQGAVHGVATQGSSGILALCT